MPAPSRWQIWLQTRVCQIYLKVIQHWNESSFLNKRITTNGFLQPENGGTISAEAPHATGAIIPRSGHVQQADSDAGKCLWEPVYHGITLGWEAPHHFLYISQRDEMVLTSAQQVSLRTPSLEPPTTAGNFGDLTSQSENTLIPDIRWGPPGLPPNILVGHISGKKLTICAKS